MQYDVLVSYNINITDSEKNITGKQFVQYGPVQYKHIMRVTRKTRTIIRIIQKK